LTKPNKHRDRRVTLLDGKRVPRAKTVRGGSSTEAEQTIDAIRAGQIDALVIPGHDSDKLYAIRSFADLEKVDAELKREESARRRSDAARRASEARFGTLATHAPVGIYLTDIAGNCTFFNRRGCEIIGLSLEDAIGRGWTNALHPDDRDEALTHFSHAAGTDGIFNAEFRFRHRDGRSVWVAARTIAIRGDDGNPTGFIGTISDISARKAAELALQEAKERMQIVLDASPVAILSMDRAGRITAWSQGAERMFGWTEREVVGRINPAVPDAELDDFHEMIRRVLAGEPYKGQVRYRRTKSGALVQTVISARPLPDASGANSGIVVILDDITEQERANEQLRALAEERERFFQDMHDGCIQSIYAVGLNLEVCRRLINTNPAKAAQRIAAASANLDLVIQDLRSFITGRGQQLLAAPDLRGEIERAVQAAGEGGPAFALHIDASAQNALTPDQALQLLQIAREGISNVARHASARSGELSLRMLDGVVTFEVIDDGIGFDTSAPTKRGLGLHHIDARARKLGGRAVVASKPSRGTRIVVEIPLKR
jgi:PAS domain S-box-containing protein